MSICVDGLLLPGLLAPICRWVHFVVCGSIAKLSLESLILPMAMTIFGLFAYSLTWKPRSSTAFRAIGTIYSVLFFLSLLLVLNHLVSQDYLMSLVTRFMAILPLTLASAYLAWMAEILIRRILIHRTLLRISQIP